MNGLVAIIDQVCNKWLVSTHLSVNNSPVQLIFNQSLREPCLQRQKILTTRAPPSYANDPQDAQEVWIIIIINITIITFRHHPSYANDPRGAEAVSTRPSYRRLPRRKLAHILLVHGIARCCLLLIVVDVFYDFLGSNTLQATSLSP